jgi:predicted O-methyltransferase YrrM
MTKQTYRQLATASLGRPVEFAERLRSRRERHRNRSHLVEEYDVSMTAQQAVHHLLTPQPNGSVACELCEPFEDAWQEIVRGTPGNHDHDSGTATALVAYSFVRHLRPTLMVETGVARGFTSAVILTAMAHNGFGHLWSIDIPPADVFVAGESGAAVPDHLRSSWTYVRGDSKRKLPPLLETLGKIDLFLHDSLHYYPTMTFEFEQAWAHLRPGGALVSDDMRFNRAFADFVTRHHVPADAIAMCGSSEKRQATGMILVGS